MPVYDLRASVPKIGGVLRGLNKIPEIAFFNLPVIFNQSKALSLATGMPMSFGEFFKSGKRSYTLERLVNTRFGAKRDLDTLPARLTDVPQDKDDPSTKVPLEKMKDTYYAARGWDKKGIPTKATMRRLGLKNLKFMDTASNEPEMEAK